MSVLGGVVPLCAMSHVTAIFIFQHISTHEHHDGRPPAAAPLPDTKKKKNDAWSKPNRCRRW